MLGRVRTSFYDESRGAYKTKVNVMSYVTFATPIYMPTLYYPTPCPPLAYYPVQNVGYRFPLPLLLPEPVPIVV
jgi:hypothetical protein